ncbi:unnamed protein product [Cylindrotheca closterium]|uniref:Sodium-dependent phosphate transport protein 2B n=1 Tax=Cylindrotheca closterium TaxID=2856 RepID=A0AAD2GC94_9STRA|nr:unnamed protein product [Cylindrotheca closterium]
MSEEKPVNSRKDRPTGSMHVGDADFDVNDPAYEMDATWGEVCKACCVRSPVEWAMAFGGLVAVFFFLYFFLVGLDLLGNGAKVMGGCAAGALFGDDMNPIAGLMVGIVATVLLQSSSTTTSIVVSLVGADSVTVKQGIFMIMGANIGTSVTNTIVAMGHLGDGDQLERAFAGATVHDMFNFLSVAILLPVEAATGYLFYLTEALVKNFKAQDGEKWEGPVKKLVSPLASRIIIVNKKVAGDIASGKKVCDDYYPNNGTLACDDYNDPLTCSSGLLSCDSKADTPYCPAFFDPEATESVDRTSGVCAFIIGLILLFICLFALVKILQRLMMGASTRVLYKATNINGYLAILIGAGITILVQSSSITTSVLTPLVGVGALRLEQMLPLTLGANIGTTVTGLLAALLGNKNGMQVALAHLFFNITGIAIWYPVPFMRNIPLNAARALGRSTRLFRGFPIIYIAVAFIAMPLIFLGISYLFSDGNSGLTALGSIIVVVLAVVLIYTGYFCKYQGGSEKCTECLVSREKRNVAVRDLPDDMEWLKAKVRELSEHTGLPIDEEEEAADVEAEIPAKEAADEASDEA